VEGPGPQTAAPASPPAAADERDRFAFGENWRRFLAVVDERRIAEAERSLREMLDRPDLSGCRFLDIGCGSGLFSLAAARLGAERIHSFDFDHESVACCEELKRRFRPDSDHWTVEPGSVLDEGYLRSLGQFDVVYSWGVLHHTGDMWSALGNATIPLAPGGSLFIAIYNDEGRRSRVWARIKRLYNRLPSALRVPYALLVMGPLELRMALHSIVTLSPMDYVHSWTRYESSRGMSRLHDILDWVGGYPFEVATPDAVFDYYRARGLQLARLTTVRGYGCNQYVLRRPGADER
jgi:SAM-dependent methyltransferase